ncbi:hypothetical protein MVEN_00899100 [Mycena venus]|uniref:F-box domain-containing protein n=1 Tax=Mycena venus TaxID=2733690 RepID=A0A8H6YGW2_9AGAR|nr:hypothetical protein MVEN_00899100 [Mycena venus]
MSGIPIHAVLSPELILEILDALAVPLQFHERSCDLSVLAACTTVCKAWSAHAQRLLFRRVILPNNFYREPHARGATRDSLPSFLAAIDPETERGRWLAESVVSFTLRHTGRGLTADSASLATALLRLPNLRHLDVTTIFCNFDPETVARLRESGPRLVSLAISKDFVPAMGQHTRIMHQLVALFPSLRLLEITSNLNETLVPFDPPPNLSLVCAKFNVALVEDIAPCLASLLNPQADAPLQVLWHKSRGGHPSVLDDVLRTHGLHLRSLALKTLDPEDASPAIAQCAVLERFEYGRFPDAAILALIPRSITALAICGVHTENGNGHFERYVDGLVQALPTFPHLKALTWSACPQPVMFPALEWMCSERGIELRISAAELTDDNAVELDLRQKYIRI